ncbi:hypothetical protein ACFHW1_05055 [Micromonospora sp. LOL_014]|uniref:hypothetical protein n=1 Tax=Micromonospora sp. LOL_014 TaxID=3345415 RepID=UPI003A88A130
MATEQPALLHDGQTAIWPRFRLPTGRINAAPWHHALSAGELVGTCHCGGYLKPGRPYQLGRVDWFPATCHACGADTAHRGPLPRGRKPTR